MSRDGEGVFMCVLWVGVHAWGSKVSSRTLQFKEWQKVISDLPGARVA